MKIIRLHTLEHNSIDNQKCVFHFELRFEQLRDNKRDYQKGGHKVDDKIGIERKNAGGQVGLLSQWVANEGGGAEATIVKSSGERSGNSFEVLIWLTHREYFFRLKEFEEQAGQTRTNQRNGVKAGFGLSSLYVA